MSAKAQPVKQPKSRAEQKLAAFHDEDSIDKSYDFQLLTRLWPFISPHARYVVISLVALLAVAGLNLLRPILMGKVVSHAGARAADLLVRDGAMLAGLVVLAQIISFGQIYCMQLAGALSMADLRRHVFRFLQGLSMRFFDKTKSIHIASGNSSPLRITLRPGQRNRFLATCWVIDEPPCRTPLARAFCTMARSVPIRSTPK